MTRHGLFKSFLFGLIAAAIFLPGRALACAACFGKSDSPLAQGMNMGILSLLGFITIVLATVAGFFIFLARKSSGVAGNVTTEPRETIPPLEND